MQLCVYRHWQIGTKQSQQQWEAFEQHLTVFQDAIKRSGGPYLMGSEVSLVLFSACWNATLGPVHQGHASFDLSSLHLMLIDCTSKVTLQQQLSLWQISPYTFLFCTKRLCKSKVSLSLLWTSSYHSISFCCHYVRHAAASMQPIMLLLCVFKAAAGHPTDSCDKSHFCSQLSFTRLEWTVTLYRPVLYRF